MQYLYFILVCQHKIITQQIQINPKNPHPMKSYSTLYPQHSTSKIQTIGHNQIHSGNNSMNRIVSSKNFSKPMGSINNSHTLNSNHTNSNQSNRFQANQLKKKEGLVKRNNNSILRDRISKSIQELPHLQTDGSTSSLFGTSNSKKPMLLTPTKNYQSKNQILIQNCQDQSQEDQQLFSSSYKKLNNIYNNFQHLKNKSSIQQQLSQILNLIKEQRSVIRTKLIQIQNKRMKKSNIMAVDIGLNTEMIVLEQGKIRNTRQAQIQTDQNDKQQNSTPCSTDRTKQSKQQIQSNQTYLKLIKILEDMNINSQLVLPKQIKVEELKEKSRNCQKLKQQAKSKSKQGKQMNEKKYQELKQSQVITVQKFVIKKLVQRITALQNGQV